MAFECWPEGCHWHCWVSLVVDYLGRCCPQQCVPEHEPATIRRHRPRASTRNSICSALFAVACWRLNLLYVLLRFCLHWSQSPLLPSFGHVFYWRWLCTGSCSCRFPVNLVLYWAIWLFVMDDLNRCLFGIGNGVICNPSCFFLFAHRRTMKRQHLKASFITSVVKRPKALCRHQITSHQRFH